MIIKNTGYAPLDITVNYSQVPESELKDTLPPINWFNVALNSINMDYELSIKYFPGLTKEFTQQFSLQVILYLLFFPAF